MSAKQIATCMKKVCTRAYTRRQKKRRAQFGTRKNILNNGFYELIPKKTGAAARLRGEISGCYEK
jgi:hypothetical protein